jgi:hypothetical protein
MMMMTVAAKRRVKREQAGGKRRVKREQAGGGAQLPLLRWLH